MRKTNQKLLKQNSLFKFILIAMALVTVVVSSGGTAFAQSDSQAATITFEQLGFSSLQLSSKFDSLSAQSIGNEILNFLIPYRWVLNGENANYLDLHYGISYVRGVQTEGLSTELPKLEIYLDNVLIANFVPQVGPDQYVRIQIPPAVVNDRSSNQHTFRIAYLNHRDCIQDVEYVLDLYNDTAVSFTYSETEPVFNLLDFPRPLIQDSFFSEDIYFVLPNEYSNSELSAVAILSQTLGDSRSTNVNIHVVSDADYLSGEFQQGSLIVIGQPLENQVLSNLYQQNLLPTTISDQGAIVGADGLIVAPDDGVLQLANANNSIVLTITGNSDEALIKAATALASANPLYGLSGDISVISDVIAEAPAPSSDTGASQLLFSDIGIQDVNLVGVGTQSVGATFYLPYDWKILDNPSLMVSYANSSALSSSSSIINVELNNNLVGSIPLDSVSLGKKQAMIQLSPDQFIPGEKNRLKLTVVMDNSLHCEQSNDALAWVQFFSDSALDIPHEVTDASTEEGAHFSNPFYYLLSSENSSKVLFVIPDSISLLDFEGVARISNLIGTEQGKNALDLLVVSASDYVPENYTENHTVLIGLPTDNPAIAGINDSLVQPFDLENGSLLQGVGNVKYVLPPAYSVGVIQVITSPWNLSKGITVISGTTEEALGWSLNTMASPTLVRQLNGDLGFVYQDNIESIVSDTATNRAVEIMIEKVTDQNVEIAVATETPASADTQQAPFGKSSGRSVAVIVLLVLVIGGLIAIVQSFVARTRSKKAGSEQ